MNAGLNSRTVEPRGAESMSSVSLPVEDRVSVGPLSNGRGCGGWRGKMSVDVMREEVNIDMVQAEKGKLGETPKADKLLMTLAGCSRNP